MRVILDSGPLITACKFEAIGVLVVDHLLDRCDIMIADSVRDEVAIAGRRYPDAQAAQQRINQGRISTLTAEAVPDLARLLEPYKLGKGEKDSILLTRHTQAKDATLVIDDHLAYLVSDRLGVRKRFLLDVLVDLTRFGELDETLAQEIVQAVRSRYPAGFVEHTLLLLER